MAQPVSDRKAVSDAIRTHLSASLPPRDAELYASALADLWELSATSQRHLEELSRGAEGVEPLRNVLRLLDSAEWEIDWIRTLANEAWHAVVGQSWTDKDDEVHLVKSIINPWWPAKTSVHEAAKAIVALRDGIRRLNADLTTPGLSAISPAADDENPENLHRLLERARSLIDEVLRAWGAPG